MVTASHPTYRTSTGTPPSHVRVPMPLAGGPAAAFDSEELASLIGDLARQLSHRRHTLAPVVRARKRVEASIELRWSISSRVSAGALRQLANAASQQAADPAQQAERLFESLADVWHRATRHMSSDHDIAMHPAYQEIIGMGEKALPLILRALQNRLDHWFWALTMIARESPVPPSEAGNQRLMRDRWLEWGRQKGYIG
jgi:hypothetical protein